MVAPSLPGGLSTHHVAFPGTVTLPEDVFGGVLDAYVAAFERMGIRRVAIISGHGGNLGFLGRYEAAHAARGSDTRLIAHHDLQGYVDAMFAGARSEGFDPPATDVHAGGVETSQGLALFASWCARSPTSRATPPARTAGWSACSPTGIAGRQPQRRARRSRSRRPPRPERRSSAHIADYLTGWIEAGLSASIGAHSKS